MLTRRNVWELGNDWAEPILWYARGVAALKARALSDPTSWRFYAAIHGIFPELWIKEGYLDANEPGPGKGLIDQFWQQCQHGSWYFLPWHRGYLLAFEAVVRAEIVKLQGPADWSLPYWNYFKPGQNRLPPAFASPNWPDGQNNNPLFVRQRYGPSSDGNVFVPTDQVNLEAMNDPDFTGVSSGGSAGFGGVDTGFSHGGTVHGGLETQPHDWVHSLIGGGTEDDPGLMSDPDTAGLDPIFWLHHANIDRLWEVWRQHPPSHADPAEARWLEGPASIGERPFSMPMPDGNAWNYTPADMATLATLGYTYDDFSAAAPPVPLAARIERLRTASIAETATPETTNPETTATMPSRKDSELLGASRTSVPVHGTEVRASIQIDKTVRDQTVRSLARAATQSTPDRVFLNLENVRGLSDAAAFHVYIAPPTGAAADSYPEQLAGSIALFGVRKASMPTEQHGGAGLTFVLEITRIIDQLHLDGRINADALDVRLVPVKPISKAAQITIGRVSLFRQTSG